MNKLVRTSKITPENYEIKFYLENNVASINEEYLKLILDKIEKFAIESDLMKLIKKLEISINFNSKRDGAYYIFKNPVRVDINLMTLVQIYSSSGQEKSLVYLEQLLKHEFFHAYQDYKTELLKKVYIIETKLKKKIEVFGSKEVRDDPNIHPRFRMTPLHLMRFYFLRFVFQLYIEGVAKYCGETIPFKPKLLLGNYNIRKEDMENFILSIRNTIENNIFNEEELDNFIQYLMYYLGQHMTYFILYSNTKTNLFELVNIDHVKFIKLYEKACNKLNFKPLISYSSKKGLFDYSSTIKELKDIYDNEMPGT